MRQKKYALAGLFAAAMVGLQACDRGGVESEPAREQAAEAPESGASSGEERRYASREDDRGGRGSDSGSAREERREDPRDGPQPVHDDGAPLWSATSRNSAAENAREKFEKNGRDFGADTVDEYVDMAHAFIAKPPSGTQKLTRNNGDRLMYDPKGNVFLVATRDGAPRTMFKPEDGAAYWEQQKQREQRRARGGGDSERG
jgi:pyocin large subunit-like protein